MHSFYKELQAYSQLVVNFPGVKNDLRVLLAQNPEKSSEICQQLELHQDGLAVLFPSQQLSATKAGYVEPLLPPMRHPQLCVDYEQAKRRDILLKMDYMIHDFAAMCRALRPSSRTVFIDMGASLDFHGGKQRPAMYIDTLYRQFGFVFDHIYAFEITKKIPTKYIKKSLTSGCHPIIGLMSA